MIGAFQSATLGHRRLWTPHEIDTTFWFDASQSHTITLTDGKVSAWASLNGGTIAQQSTADYRPSVSTTAFGGMPALDFKTSHRFLTFNNPVTQNVVMDIWTVLDSTENNSGNHSDILSRSTNSIYGPALYLYLSNKPSIYLHEAGYFHAVQANPIARPFIAEFVYNRSSGYCSTQIDGDSASLVIDSATQEGISEHIAINTNYEPQACSALYAEIICIHGSVLSADNRAKMEGYLSHKWNLTANLPSDHPYKSSPPKV